MLAATDVAGTNALAIAALWGGASLQTLPRAFGAVLPLHRMVV